MSSLDKNSLAKIMKGVNYHNNYDPVALVECARCGKKDAGKTMCWVNECKVAVCPDCWMLWDDDYFKKSGLEAMRKTLKKDPLKNQAYLDLWDKTFKRFLKDGRPHFICS